MPAELNKLMDIIGYHFKKPELLKQAFTHSSYANECRINRICDYERLEFLGDAVLEMITSHALILRYPDKHEGELSKLRASLVCEYCLAQCARELHYPDYVYLSKGERQTGGAQRDSLLCDLFESVLGAIYLDGGMQPAKAFIDRFILSDLEDKRLFYDSKSNLQELIQGKLKKEFEYRLLEESGPEHDKTFVVEIDMEGECLGRGQGRTKKAAEQQAAYEALLLLRDRGYVFKKY